MCSSASLLVDGEVVGAVHEERFSRRKNEVNFPIRSIEYLLDNFNLSINEIDAVAIASFSQPFEETLIQKYCTWSVEDYVKEQREIWKPFLIEGEKKQKVLSEVYSNNIVYNQFPGEDYWKDLLTSPPAVRQSQFDVDRERLVAEYLGISRNKVKRINHHRCHSHYAYYSSPYVGEKTLCFTIDGMGDGSNATIGIFDEKGEYKKILDTDKCYIGRIYRYMTLLLGMKPNEHEFKVMGLAPYGKEKYSRVAYEVFAETLCVDGLDFKWNIQPDDNYYWFKSRLEGVRFDNIASGLQKWCEDLIVEWVDNAIKELGVSQVVISGGVAMNIKAMGKVAELDSVKKLFIGGSGSDESMAISAGICLYEDLIKDSESEYLPKLIKPFNLYLGPTSNGSEEDELVKNIDQSKFEIFKEPTSEHVADLLTNGLVIGRCSGRMEFGQRALGNRSIIADPIRIETKEKINKMIKNRDFWMPFAPIVKDNYSEKYLINPKNLLSPFMTIGFQTTPEGYESMKASCHPADKSARPQIMDKASNPLFYEILEEFERKTGRGAVLNTSFNLHGYPIVNTAQDAYFVFVNSGLDALLLNNYLILKKENNCR